MPRVRYLTPPPPHSLFPGTKLDMSDILSETQLSYIARHLIKVWVGEGPFDPPRPRGVNVGEWSFVLSHKAELDQILRQHGGPEEDQRTQARIKIKELLKGEAAPSSSASMAQGGVASTYIGRGVASYGYGSKDGSLLQGTHCLKPRCLTPGCRCLSALPGATFESVNLDEVEVSRLSRTSSAT